MVARNSQNGDFFFAPPRIPLEQDSQIGGLFSQVVVSGRLKAVIIRDTLLMQLTSIIGERS
jgi:hypothetical protein